MALVSHPGHTWQSCPWGLSFFLSIYLSIYLFIYFWLSWVFVAAHELSLVVASGGYSSLQCAGFSLRWLLLLQSTGSRRLGSVVVASVVVARGLSSCGFWALECRLSSCGARAYLLRSMWDLPGPGLEPVSLALAGGFLTSVPPGKSLPWSLSLSFIYCRDGQFSSLWACQSMILNIWETMELVTLFLYIRISHTANSSATEWALTIPKSVYVFGGKKIHSVKIITCFLL